MYNDLLLLAINNKHPPARDGAAVISWMTKDIFSVVLNAAWASQLVTNNNTQENYVPQPSQILSRKPKKGHDKKKQHAKLSVPCLFGYLRLFISIYIRMDMRTVLMLFITLSHIFRGALDAFSKYEEPYK